MPCTKGVHVHYACAYWVITACPNIRMYVLKPVFYMQEVLVYVCTVRSVTVHCAVKGVCEKYKLKAFV